MPNDTTGGMQICRIRVSLVQIYEPCEDGIRVWANAWDSEQLQGPIKRLFEWERRHLPGLGMVLQDGCPVVVQAVWIGRLRCSDSSHEGEGVVFRMSAGTCMCDWSVKQRLHEQSGRGVFHGVKAAQACMLGSSRVGSTTGVTRQGQTRRYASQPDTVSEELN